MQIITSKKADLSLVFVSLLWGSSFVVIKYSLASVTPFWLVFMRFLIASLALWMLCPRFWRGLRVSTVWYSGLIGMCLFLGFAFQTLGLQYTSPAKSAFITGSSILMVPLFNRAIFRIVLRKGVSLGILIASAGLYMLTRPDDFSKLNWGDVFTLMCAVAFAFHIILLGRFTLRVPYRQLAVLQMFWSLLLSSVPVLVMGAPSLNLPVSGYLALLYLGVFCSALSFFIQTHAQQYTSAARTALIFSLEPVFAALLSIGFYGEELAVMEWLGGCLTVAGVMVGELHVIRSIEEQISGSSV